MVPEEVGEGIGDAGEDGKEVIFKGADGMFRGIAVMDIWRENLEIAVPLINNGVAILGDRFIVNDLEINSVALGFEARHDDVVGSNVIPVIE